MRICIFGASSRELAQKYYTEAEELGRLIASEGHTLVFGGGDGGLMGACARGVTACGGECIGIAPRYFDEPGILYSGCTRLEFTDTMRERKARMEAESDAVIVLPGGVGTFEEFFEILTLKQIGRLHKPIAVLNTHGYYEGLLAMLRHATAEGFMTRGCLELFALVDTPEAALAHVTRGVSS